MSARPTLDKTVLAADAEDDLDDLDDLLDQFGTGNKTPTGPSPVPPNTATTTTTFGNRPRTNTRVDGFPESLGSGSGVDADDEDVLSSEFAKELAKGMENLIRGIGVADPSDPNSTTPNPNPSPRNVGMEDLDGLDPEEARVFQVMWDTMIREGLEDPEQQQGAGTGTGTPRANGPAPPPPSSSSSSQPPRAGFQDKIKQAMDKMKQTEERAKAAESGAGGAGTGTGTGLPPGLELEELLKSLSDLGLDKDPAEGLSENADSEAELAGLLESMMGQLMSKEILYEPLKELADGFPGYLANPPQPLSPEDRERYASQFSCVKRIVTIFNSPSYSDSSSRDNKAVVDLMSEMQSYGAPPPEIMGPLPPGFGEGGFNPNDENCIIV